MRYVKCPKCKKKIDAYADECPFCGELIFHDPIIATIKDNEEEEVVKEKEESSEKKHKISKNNDNVEKKKSNKKKIGKVIDKTRKKYITSRNKFRKSKLYPYITYQNILCVITLICTVAMVCMGIKVAKYSDNKSTLSKIDVDTTYQDVEKMEKKEEVKKKLDFKRGLIILEYENQEYAGINTTISYETNLKTEKVNQTVITFPSNKKDIATMKKYLEVNYGYGKVTEDKTILYVDDEIRYTFTNGAYHMEGNDTKERVEIIPLN